MNDKLKHSGIKGMKWGIRRYQNEDGSLTPAGKERYYNSTGKSPYTSGISNSKSATLVTNSWTKDKSLYNKYGGNNVVTGTYRVNYSTGSDGQVHAHTIDPTSGGSASGDVSMTDEELRKLLGSDYADLSDEELDKLYMLTKDISILKYKVKRQADLKKYDALPKVVQKADAILETLNDIYHKPISSYFKKE
jgi:hypothetical protein